MSYGVRVFTRDGRARLVPADSYVVRPRYAFGPQLAQPLALRVPGEPPAYELRATFALFDDGTWWGSPDRARREIETIREEFDVLSALSQSLVAAGEAPTRDDVRAISARCARQLAAARTRGARRQLEDVMRRLAVDLDDSRAEPAALVLAVVRDRVERALARYEPLGFVRRPPSRG